MKETIQIIAQTYQNYMGTGFYFILFLIAILLHFLQRKKGEKQNLFFDMSLLLLLLFFNPLFAKAVMKILGDEIYYRTIWLFPITILLAYTVTHNIAKAKSFLLRVIILIFSGFLLVFGGSYVYHHSGFQKAENFYHLPQDVIDLCDAIMVDGWNIKAAFPKTMVTYVRQYTTTIEMPYGREKILQGYTGYNDLFYALEDEVLHTETVVAELREAQCPYLILPNTQKVDESFTKYGFLVYSIVGDYTIYHDEEIEN